MALSFSALAVTKQDCDNLARQMMTSNNSSADDLVRAKQAMKSYDVLCNRRRAQEEPEPQSQNKKPMNTPPQYVPSSKQWCQMTMGVLHCWH